MKIRESEVPLLRRLFEKYGHSNIPVPLPPKDGIDVSQNDVEKLTSMGLAEPGYKNRGMRLTAALPAFLSSYDREIQAIKDEREMLHEERRRGMALHSRRVRPRRNSDQEIIDEENES